MGIGTNKDEEASGMILVPSVPLKAHAIIQTQYALIEVLFLFFEGRTSQATCGTWKRKNPIARG